MRCPECGSEIAENAVFCGSCGAEIVAVAEQSVPEQNASAGSENEKKPKGKKKKNSAKISENKRKLVLIITAAVAAVVLIVIIIVFVAASVKAAKGRKIFDKVPLGRNIAMIEAETGESFISGKDSPYGVSPYSALNYIADYDYDYLCESEKSVEVGGINLPEWAILLDEDYSGNISEATFYNFSILKYNWMGEKMAAQIESSSVIEYGMKIKSAERALGMKPYAIVKENGQNTSTYTYRYHYVDADSGNTFVMNLYVVVDDSDGKVKYFNDTLLDHTNLILRGTQPDDLVLQ